MDEVCEGCRAKEGIARAHGRGEGAQLVLHILTNGINLWLEMRHVLLVDGFASDIDELALLADDLAIAYLNGCLSDFDSIT